MARFQIPDDKVSRRAMLSPWPVAPRWKFLPISAAAWKPPGSTCWHCFVLWTACI
jgi:hypothetical protein